MRAVDLSIVTYAPDFALLEQLLASLAEPTAEPLARHLFIHDNSADADVERRLRELPAFGPGGGFAGVEIARSGTNVGFGRGHNANASRGASPFILVVNQDCVLEPGVLEPLVEAAARDDPRIAAWELRQIPYEHPKAYDPVTLDTPWASAAALLVRREAFESVGGFEPRIFMYGEDVDLSWRLRAKGWRIAYRPRFAVVHRAYRIPAEVKPLQVFGGVATNLCLRARFGGVGSTLKGLAMLVGEILAPQSFPGRRLGLMRAGLRFLARWPQFAWTSVKPTADFKPCFIGWGYEVRREGAFHEFASRRARPGKPEPLVSVLIRTAGRPLALAEALASCANQTYRNLEVIVIEDGPDGSRDVVDGFRDRLAIDYLATGERVGRAAAGNLALERAHGEWLNFLDDDDLLFADHLEVLVDTVLACGVRGAYSLAWETQTEFLDAQRDRYREISHTIRHQQHFDRLTLWHHNYLPIQAVLFHRSLWELHGGFAVDMDQLEDWNLWTRYTLEDDFALVEKTTSKYRVPADAREAALRQELLDNAYVDALERQRELAVTLSPRAISEMADAYVRGQAVMMVTRSDLRRFLGSHRVLARLAAYRHPARRVMRRLGWRR